MEQCELPKLRGSSLSIVSNACRGVIQEQEDSQHTLRARRGDLHGGPGLFDTT